MVKNKLRVIVCDNKIKSDFEFDEEDTFGEFKEKIKKNYVIGDEYGIYNVNSNQYLYFRDESSMGGIIKSKGLYNEDEIRFRKELKIKPSIYQRIYKCLFFT